MRTLATLAALGAALLVGSPAFAQHYSPGHHHQYKQQHHFKHAPTYHKPTYHKPTYEKKEVCFKWVKNGYGHATKHIIPCPEHVEKKEVPVEKPAEKTEQPTEQK